jgi:protein-tyrosine phosphatase
MGCRSSKATVDQLAAGVQFRLWTLTANVDIVADSRLRLLVVCTANICRSPVSAMLLDRALLDRSIDAIVESAGFLTEDEPACPTMQEFAQGVGLDLSFHRSRLIDRWLVGDARLILTMQRSHARDVMTKFDTDLERLYTVGGILAEAQAAPPRGGGLDPWLAERCPHRTHLDFVGDSCADDVIDPHGQSRRVHRRTFDQLSAAMNAVADIIADAL